MPTRGFRLTRLRALLVAALVSAPLGGCRHTERYVWVDELPMAANVSGESIIGPGDTLSITVLGQEGLSGKSRVRDDGRISLLFLDDVPASGLTVAALSEQLRSRLKSYLAAPVVTVALDQVHPYDVSVLGEVARPGVYALQPGAGVLHAVASAGGLTEYAHEDRIFVIRQAPELMRIRFDFRALSRADGRATRFRLQRGDVVVVE